jgi:anthranilate phosphoribosyltransferase
MLKEYLTTVIGGKSLSPQQAESAFEAVLAGADLLQAVAFFAALQTRGETAAEIASFVRVMRRRQLPLTLQGPLLDIVGTGGDGSHSVNISTGAAIVAASCGARVAKHGNRAASSRCGSADVLEALGIPLEAPPHKSLEEAGIAFLFSQHYHPSARQLADLRRKVGVRTVLNVLGALVNPAAAEYTVLGVYDPRLLPLLADALIDLGIERGLVVHGQGMDELSPLGPCEVVEIALGTAQRKVIDPREFGIPLCSLADLKGADAPQNAALLLETFRGRKGAIADALALSAGAGLYVYGLAASVADGVELAQASLREGRPFEVVNKWSKVSHG